MPDMTSHGDEDEHQVKVLSNLLNKIFRQQIISPPPVFEQGDNIEAHLSAVEEYLTLATITAEKEKIAVLLNSLCYDCRAEVKMQFEFDENKNNFSWIKNKILDLFRQKVSETSVRLKLFKIKQGQDSTAEFIRKLRIKAACKIEHLDANEREFLMLEAFFNGLNNQVLAKTVRTLQPRTLDEALKFVKDERSESKSEDICAIHQDQDFLLKRIDYLEKQVNSLKEKVFYLEKVSGPRVHYLKNTHEAQQNAVKICYNCGSNSHSTNFCKSPKVCFRCKKTGHFKKDCRVNLNNSGRHAVNQLELDSNASDVTNYSKDVQEDNAGEFTEVKGRSRKRKTNPSDYLVDKYVDYVNGQGEMPEEYCLEMRPTNAKVENKPVVFCRYFNEKQLTLLDTGASCNVIGDHFVNILKKKYPLNIEKSRISSIKCANGSSMECFGEVKIPFSIGGSSNMLRFLVVSGLSRDYTAIIGLRSMKSLGLKLSLKNDCVYWRNILIPFESIINPETIGLFSKNTKSGNWTQLRQ